eukprot:4595876-Pyramimonas_sp.AAC.1
MGQSGPRGGRKIGVAVSGSRDAAKSAFTFGMRLPPRPAASGWTCTAPCSPWTRASTGRSSFGSC